LLKKGTKKPWPARPGIAMQPEHASGVEQRVKVFWFFFSKKNCFLPCFHAGEFFVTPSRNPFCIRNPRQNGNHVYR
jgi:hypothetical protein